VVYDIDLDVEAEQTDEYSLRIILEESKATVAGFSYDARYIIVGHEDGSVTQWDGKVRITPSIVGDYKLNTGFLEWRSIRTDFPSRTGSCNHRPTMVSRPHILHHSKQRQNRKSTPSPPTVLFLLLMPSTAHHSRRTQRAEDLCCRYPTQQCRHNTNKGLCYTGWWSSSHGCHNYFSATG